MNTGLSNLSRLRRFFSEIIASSYQLVERPVRTFTRRIQSIVTRPTKSWGRSDYDYWRRAYLCKVVGLEFAGLFIRPIVSKISTWVLGRMPHFRMESDASRAALEEWMKLHHPEILRAYLAALKQGDSFIVINADLSITILPPEIVDPIVDDADYTRIIGWRITQVIPHPQRTSDKQVVVDEYYADRRVQRVETGQVVRERVFDNLLGVIPVVHIANQVTDGEVFGHPEAEALVDLLHGYNQILESAIEGNILQGRATPVFLFKTAQDLDKFWAKYGATRNRTLADGTTEAVDELDLDLSQALTMSGADFKYASPDSFAEDTERLLGLLFYLLLEHTEIPEFVFGNAVSSSKASAEVQMPVFEKFIEMRQGDCMAWMVSLCQIVLRYLSLTTPGVTVEEVKIQWPKLTQNNRLTFETLQWAYENGLIDRRTALMLAPVGVEDIDRVLAEGEREAEERREKMIEVSRLRPQAEGVEENQEMEAGLRQQVERLLEMLSERK